MSESGTAVSGPPGEVATSLERGINWWGAFVIGLAGIILVTGIVPFAVQAMGAAAIPAIALVLVIGLVVCLCMGELAALLPHRTGGMPSYAYESFRPLGKTDGEAHRWRVRLELLAGLVPGGADQHDPGRRLHRRAVPCAAGSHVARPARWSRHAGVHRRACSSRSSGWSALFIPCYLGIRLGAELRHHPRRRLHGARSPCWSSCRCSSPAASTGRTSRASTTPIRRRPGTVFFLAGSSSSRGTRIAMEAAACYIGECRDPRPGRQDRPHRRGPLRACSSTSPPPSCSSACSARRSSPPTR